MKCKNLIVMLFMFMFPLYVDAEAFSLNEIDLSISFNDKDVVFTRDNLNGNSNLKGLKLKEEEINNMFYDNYVYIDAFINDNNLEFVLQVFDDPDSPINNLSNYDDVFVKNSMDIYHFESELEDVSVYKNNYKYVYGTQKSEQYNMIFYYTIVNRKSYIFCVRKDEDITAREKEEFKEIVDTVTFDIKPEYKDEIEDETDLEQNQSKKYFNSAVLGGIIGIISYLIIWLLLKKCKK